MNTAVALEASILKWEGYATATHWDNVRVRAEDCPLCHLYHPEYTYPRSPAQNCEGCPVKAKSGAPFCRQTPYIEAAEALRNWKLNGIDGGPEFRAAAHAEAEFLKSLRSKA